MKPVQKTTDNHGYRYSKPVNKYLSVIETFEDGRQRQHKLHKSGSSTIGRSGSNNVILSADKYVSRSHCKIIVEKNVPYLMDLGQAKEGTKLNGKRIVKAPLKPGDLIGIGKSNIIFQVKHGAEIFTMDGGSFVSQEDSESFSSSENTLKMSVKLEDD